MTRRNALAAMLLMPLASRSFSRSVSRFHALLVGVSDYENRKIPKLRGPGNDVAYLQQMLIARGAPPERVRVLTNPIEPTEVTTVVGLPNREDILAELDRLSFVAGPDDIAFFHYSGHGCRTPQLPGARGGEKDGLDEVILPADTRSWNGRIGFVENAIRDDEIGVALGRVRSVCTTIAIFDNCFANTATKSAFGDDGLDIRYRAVSPSALGLPDTGQFVVPKGAGPSTNERRSEVMPRAQIPGDGYPLIAMYATPEDRRAPEVRLPGPDDVERVYGVFSWLLARTLADRSVETAAHLFDGAYARRLSRLSRISPVLLDKTPAPILEDPLGQSGGISLVNLI